MTGVPALERTRTAIRPAQFALLIVQVQIALFEGETPAVLDLIGLTEGAGKPAKT